MTDSTFPNPDTTKLLISINYLFQKPFPSWAQDLKDYPKTKQRIA